MHFREPVILERKMRKDFQTNSLINTFIQGYCEVLNMKLNHGTIIRTCYSSMIEYIA